MTAILLALALLAGNPLPEVQGPLVWKEPSPLTKFVDGGWEIEIRLGHDGLWISVGKIAGVDFEVARAACGENPWFFTFEEGSVDTAWFSLEENRAECIETLIFMEQNLTTADGLKAVRQYTDWLLRPQTRQE